MTKHFKALMMIYSLIPIMVVSAVFFFPTLGHSWKLFDRIFNSYCKIYPEVFSKGTSH